MSGKTFKALQTAKDLKPVARLRSVVQGGTYELQGAAPFQLRQDNLLKTPLLDARRGAVLALPDLHRAHHPLLI